MYLNEIGLEIEMFLLDQKNNILEPALFGFPADEMGFLIEIRTHHSNTGKSVYESLCKNIEWNEKKAGKLGLKINITPYMHVTNDFQNYITNKYHHDKMADQTRNIYGLRGSHHTGFCGDLATAGMHVHFSSREIEGLSAKVIKLPVENIVKCMDEEFVQIIEDVHRLKGEYELKSHGFEYRSLPTTAPAQKVITTSLKILNDMVK